MNENKQSVLGIAAFILSCISFFAILVLVLLAGFIEATTPGGMNETSIEAILIGSTLFAFIGLSLLGFVLGMAGLFQKERKKIFAIIAVLIAAATLILTIGIIVLGLTM